MIVLAGGDLVLPDHLVRGGSLVIDGARVAAIEQRTGVEPERAQVIDIRECYVVPGFVDVHVHGIAGHDTLDEGDAVSRIAERLPRYGVTAFCPTTVACHPSQLKTFLEHVRRARVSGPRAGARVLPAHLESNFINPEYRGAQPSACLCLSGEGTLGLEILEVIAASRPDVGIVTLAPELPGGIDLVRSLAASGHRVALGHSGADYETAIAAIEAGARHATHLFNRMTKITHRAPGLAGAVLAREDVAAELICDGYHVHPAMSRVAISAKSVRGVMAITDGTAGSGLPIGSSSRLGGQTIHVRDQAAFLDDGTLAGSTLTMDRAFRNIVTSFGASISDAATMCATTPARALGLTGLGVLAVGAIADVVVLDRGFRVVRTFVGGEEIYTADQSELLPSGDV